MSSLDKLLRAFELVRNPQGTIERGKGNTAEDTSSNLISLAQNNNAKGTESSSGGPFSSLVSHSSQSLIRGKEQHFSTRDKLLLCQSVTDSVLIGSKSNTDTQKLISIGIETLLLLTDDDHPDVRMNADEALNRIIRNMAEVHSSKLLLELFKEIKKNGRTRILRASLSKFSDLCQYIRPQKCRAYVQNLIPHLTRIARRQEESLLDTLTSSLEKILPLLGHFTNDNEIRSLMKAFLPNAMNSAASIRRSSTASLLLLCKHSRKPNFFFLWLLDTILQLMIPVNKESLSHEIIGGLLMLRQLASYFHFLCSSQPELVQQCIDKQEMAAGDNLLTFDQVAQIYELCIHYCGSSDTSIITASLETLQVLLQNPCSHFMSLLLSSEGITRSRILQGNEIKQLSSRTASQISIVSTLQEEEIALDTSDMKGRIEFGERDDIEHCILESSLRGAAVESNTTSSTEKMTRIPSQNLSDDEDGSDYHEEVEDGDGDSDLYASIEVGRVVDDPTPLETSQVHTGQTCATIKRKRKTVQSSIDEVCKAEIKEDSTKASGSIGSFLDEDIPAKFLCRFLCSSFLLSGRPCSLISDQVVKVSVKVLALNCFGLTVSLQPSLLATALFIREGDNDSELEDEEGQRMNDALLFKYHHDPQLKSSVAVTIGLFIHSCLGNSKGDYDDFGRFPLSLPSLLELIENLLTHESSITVRGALTSLRVCLPEILHSPHVGAARSVINQLVNICNHAYWLVKVDLCDLFSSIPIRFIEHIETNFTKIGFDSCKHPQFSIYGMRFSHRLVSTVYLPLLGDADPRVRTASASAIQRLVPQLSNRKDVVLASSDRFNCEKFCSTALSSLGSVDGEGSFGEDVQPEEEEESHSRQVTLELTKLVQCISTQLLTSTNKYMKLGCLEALASLIETYKPFNYPQAWLCHCLPKQQQQQPSNLKSNHVGLASLVLSLSGELPLSSDLQAQQHILIIASFWLTGRLSPSLNINDQDAESSGSGVWASLRHPRLRVIADLLIRHILRILNVYYHVLEETPPGARNTLPNTGPVSALSPIKRRTRSDADKDKGRAHSPGKSHKADGEEKEKKASKTGFVGVFVHLPEYIRLYEVVKNAHTNYKMCLDDGIKQKLCGLLETSLSTLGVVFQIGSMAEFGHLAEELLQYFKVISSLLPASTIVCGQRLLNCFFGTSTSKAKAANSAPKSPWQEFETVSKEQSKKPDVPNLHEAVFGRPAARLQRDFESLMKGNHSLLDSSSLMKKNKSSTNLSSHSKGSGKTSLSSYIRLFEPLVIKALKLYTVSSDVRLQRSVLELLIHLVEIRVNYCLLDSEQIFIGYIIKQFEYIEEGQIKNAEELIPSVFKFLVLLSYERHHSKTIIGVPKIIQLCDGLLASGQPPLSHCVLALRPLVTDLFLERGQNSGTDQKELETQKEVLCSMLLRLAHYHQVLHLISLVLVTSQRVDKERWRKLSYQVLETLLQLISKLKVNINSKESLTAVGDVLKSVCQTVLLPPDAILKAMLTSPCEIQTTEEVERWMGGILILLRILISHTQVDVILSRLEHLGLSLDIVRPVTDSMCSSIHSCISPKRFISPKTSLMVSSGDSGSSLFRDPLNVVSPSVNPAHSLARFLLEVLLVSTSELGSIQCSNLQGSVLLGHNAQTPSSEFLVHLTYHLLLTWVHLAETGQWQAVVTALKDVIRTEPDLMEEVASRLLYIARWHPVLTLLWCRLLTLLDVAAPLLWSNVLKTTQKPTSIASSNGDSPGVETKGQLNCLSLDFLRRAGVLVLSEFVVRHIQEDNWLTWLLVQHINDLMMHFEETPVQNLLKEVYASAAASSLLLQAVYTRCYYINSAEYGGRVVALLSGLHSAQSGPLVSFLIEHILPSPFLVISRAAASICSQRLHFLIAEDSHQLTQMDIQKLILAMREESLEKRYGQVCSLLQQLLSLCGQEAELFFSETQLPVRPAADTSLDLNWYLELVSSRCSVGGGGGQECGKLLSQLDYSDILLIMTSKRFNRGLLPHTFKHGLTSVMQANSPWSDYSSSAETVGSDDDVPVGKESPLFTASKVVLVQHLHELEACLPGPHMSYNPGGGNEYCDQLTKMFSGDHLARESVERLASSILPYLEGLASLPWKTEFHPDETESILRFAVVCLEYLHWRLSAGGVGILMCSSCFSCVHSILKNSALANFLSLSGKDSFICSMIYSLHALVLQFISPISLPSLPKRLRANLESLDGSPSSSCQMLLQLILWLEINGEKELPQCLAQPIRGICQGLGRTRLLNSIVRLPPELWSLGWCPQLTFDSEAALPPVPVDLLQEMDVLKQFIFRIGLFGFVGRLQFEETWMLLLSVLNSVPTPETPSLQVPFINLSLSLSVKGITSLLIQSLLTPDPGNPHSSILLSVEREATPTYFNTSTGRKLSNVRRQLDLKLSEVSHIVRSSSSRTATSSYSGGQLSVEFLVAAMVSSQDMEEDSVSRHLSAAATCEADRREKHLISCGLDVQSCLQFLRDNLFSIWLQSNMCSSVVAEVVKSISMLCDLFTTSAHHKWVLEVLVPLHSSHPIEDHITFQYIVLATSKSYASLKSAHQEVISSLAEGVVHIMEAGLRHSQGSVRALAVQGMLYILQAPQENNTLVTLSANFILKHHDSKGRETEIQETLLWDMWLYLVEHYSNLPDPTLPSTALHMALTTAASSSTSPRILKHVLLGVERLILVQQVSSNPVEVVLKLVMDLILNSSTATSLVSLPLFLTALYSSTKLESSSALSDPETLLQFLEKLQVLFERIRIGQPFEAEVIGDILGTCLLDILPASQILNKVITEYISSNQPYPHLLASALFQVFEAAINEGGDGLVQEWVLLSLSNFTQRTPVALAVWCLTCFFIAASRDHWLRSAFPSVQARLGKLDPRDIQVFCLAAAHFRRSLASSKHRMKFDDVFQAVATPDSPFEALLHTVRKYDSDSSSDS